MSVIELKNLSYSYHNGENRVPVLKNVNFRIEKGEFVAIQGPSGSGKSTLLYLMGCLLKKQEGELLVKNQDITLFKGEELAHFRNRTIGFVFQQFHLLARTSVLQNILLPTHYYSKAGTSSKDSAELLATEKTWIAKAKKIAANLGLTERLDHGPQQLSGGQQQRVAIARSLILDPEFILADEPTGNLDSQTSAQIMTLFKELNSQGKTIIVITHDNDIAAQCSRIIRVRDGQVVEDTGASVKKQDVAEKSDPTTKNLSDKDTQVAASAQNTWRSRIIFAQEFIADFRNHIPAAMGNLLRNKVRSFLNMLGVLIGISSLVVMVTLGQFTKRKILDSYAELGINSFLFYGQPNWDFKAKDKASLLFRAFEMERDLIPLKRIFPEIEKISPTLTAWRVSPSFGGRSIEGEASILGVNSDALVIANKKMIMGNNISPFHVENKSAVCVIGYEIAERIFRGVSPLNQMLSVTENTDQINCRVIGVLASSDSKNDWLKPNLQILMPYTYFQASISEPWFRSIRQVLIQAYDGSDVQKVGNGIRAFFEQKYGKSGRFRVDSDSLLIAQMNRFLNLFTLMLTVIALVSLAVGGIGITNMMLVSVSERLREIGLKKALGATDKNIRFQFLTESILLCALAGVTGLVLGVVTYHGIIFIAAQFVPKLKFEIVFDWMAMGLSFISIFLVGIISGYFPALRAEKLQVIEALRSE